MIAADAGAFPDALGSRAAEDVGTCSGNTGGTYFCDTEGVAVSNKPGTSSHVLTSSSGSGAL
jgi:hypothetical protein